MLVIKRALIGLIFFETVWAQEATSSDKVQKQVEQAPVLSLGDICYNSLIKFPGKHSEAMLREACKKVQRADLCKSVEGKEIYHYDKLSSDDKSKRVLVFSLIHGDETPAGSVGRYWMERLETIAPRNSWRVVPILNPDGVLLKTRTNANKVDVNRNFPTKDWEETALHYWEKQTKSNPRRFPGSVAGSEPETKCALYHIDDFKPDFIVSVHTPLKVLDFDGPKINPPKFDYLPWVSLGHMPGSLGRFMWFERSTPVLTMELKADLPSSYGPFEQLQDIIGKIAQYEAPSAIEKMKKAEQKNASLENPEEH
ncbi:MAG: M14 family zinc carboxypeptidase [Bdellovibrionia bacterium]